MIASDEQLIERCARKDAEAFEELLRRYRGPLLGFIFGMVRDFGAAEEVFQDTFLKIYDKADTFREGSRFRTWLYAIAANRARDELRRLKRRRSLSLDAPLGQEETGTHGDLMESSGPGPDDLAAAREYGKLLDEKLAGLSRAHREVVILSRLNGLTYKEISRVLGVPPGTVRSRLHYALEHLRREMSRYRPELGEAGAQEEQEDDSGGR